METIIQAASQLPAIQFYFVGGREADLRRLGLRDKITANVHFAGKLDFTEMPLWHTAADVLLVTGTKNDDYSYHYTSPMKLFEYMAAKRPIVASRTPAIAQVVLDNEVFFHQPDNPHNLEMVIASVFNQPDQARRRAEQAYHKAEELSWDKRAERVLAFIRQRL